MTDDSLGLTRLEAKIDSLAVIVEERLKGIDHKIEFGDRSALQTVQILAESLHRLEGNQQEQGRTLRYLDPVPTRLSNLETREVDIERRIALLERDRAKLVGFLLGAAAAGGGIGAAIAQLLGT